MDTSSPHYPTMGQGAGIPWHCCNYPALRLLPISGRSSPCDPVRRIADDSTRLFILPSSPFSHESGPAGCADCRDELPKTSLVQSSWSAPETTIAQEGGARMCTAYEAPTPVVGFHMHVAVVSGRNLESCRFGRWFTIVIPCLCACRPASEEHPRERHFVRDHIPSGTPMYRGGANWLPTPKFVFPL